MLNFLKYSRKLVLEDIVQFRDTGYMTPRIRSWIVMRRISLGLSRVQFAKMLHVTFQTLANWETGMTIRCNRQSRIHVMRALSECSGGASLTATVQEDDTCDTLNGKSLYRKIRSIITLYEQHHGINQKSQKFLDGMVNILCDDQHGVTVAVYEGGDEPSGNNV